MGFIPHHEEEGRLRGDRVGVVVMGKFGESYRVSPRGGVISAEDSKVSFNLLIDSFSFSVRLGMVRGRQGEVVV